MDEKLVRDVAAAGGGSAEFSPGFQDLEAKVIWESERGSEREREREREGETQIRVKDEVRGREQEGLTNVPGDQAAKESHGNRDEEHKSELG